MTISSIGLAILSVVWSGFGAATYGHKAMFIKPQLWEGKYTNWRWFIVFLAMTGLSIWAATVAILRAQ